MRVEIAPGRATLGLELGVTTPPEPAYSLSTAGDDAHLPRSRGRRQWGLVLGAPQGGHVALSEGSAFFLKNVECPADFNSAWPGSGVSINQDIYGTYGLDIWVQQAR